MTVKLDDLDALLGYDSATHSLKGLPSLAKPGPLQLSAKELLSPPTTIPSIGAAQPQPAAPGTMPSVMPNAGTASPTAGIPSIDTGSAPSLAKPKESFWQKLGHGVEKGAEIAGDVLAPGVTAMIPGTQLNKELEQKRQWKQLGQQADIGFKQAETEKAKEDVPFEKAQTEALTQKTGEEPALTSSEIAEHNAQTVALLHPQAKTDFEAWQQQHPGEPIENWLKTVAANKPPPTAAPPHITSMVGGKPHIMERDPQTGNYSIDRGEAPPNYAQVAPSLRTVDVLNDQGVPTIQTLTGRTVGQAATGAFGHEEAQAGAVTRAGSDLIKEVQANRDKFGNVSAILNSAFLGTPLSDPVSSRLASQIRSFAALNPSMHGFRGKDALDEFAKLLGGLPNNPDSLVAGIQGILSTAGSINPQLQGAGGGAAPTGSEGRKSVKEWLEERNANRPK